MTDRLLDDLDLRADLAVRGVRVDAPVQRTGGAGPSDDGHLVLLGLPTTLPVAGNSPYSVVGDRLLRDGLVLDDVEVTPVERPRFYDLTTSDGVAMDQVARLHGKDVLASTVIQTCTRYGDDDTAEQTRCRFCAVERSLDAGVTTAVKTPQQLAEVARAAVDLDGIRSVVLTTGTTPGSDRGAAHLHRCVRAITAAVPGLPVQVQCEPPGDSPAARRAWLQRLHDAGATTIGMHAESLDEDVRRRWTPGKATVPLTVYDAAWDDAVEVFGRNRVSTYVLLGLGEDPDETVDACGQLIDRGIYPFVVPFRPLAGTLAADVPAPDPGLVADVSTRVAAKLAATGMRGADQQAGCAACGACGLLAAAGG
jgi:radical SAM protein (TIGR04043 family)